MLDGAGDDVVAPVPVGQEDALERVVVGLGAAAGEDDLVGPGPEERGHLARARSTAALAGAARPVVARRIAEVVAGRAHRLHHLGSEGVLALKSR